PANQAPCALEREMAVSRVGEEPRIMRDGLVAAKISAPETEEQDQRERTHAARIGRAMRPRPVRFLRKFSVSARRTLRHARALRLLCLRFRNAHALARR